MRTSPHRRRALAALSTLSFAGLLLLGAAGPAEAHGQLVSTDPGEGDVLDVAPTDVTLTFDEDMLDVSPTVVVEGPDGEVTAGDATVDGRDVVQTLRPNLPGGDYTVDWRIASADGHPVDGTFAFTIALATSAPTESVGAVAEPSDGAGGASGGGSADDGADPSASAGAGEAASDGDGAGDPSAAGDNGLVATRDPSSGTAQDAADAADDDAAGSPVPLVLAVVVGLAVVGAVVVLLVRRSRGGALGAPSPTSGGGADGTDERPDGPDSAR
ncbi:copper resistance CopC family protein [Cellulomonas sp. PhB143]|uniref:copper resistance CopC family protein n=1 Tax=Cellulomonas sp. PhB143 TaxID=2485186 RepID=UPI000F467E99|nr:copper resistance CopC family protein [Cellulomonas sp. PhB143]ROS79111.1 methionine-rich copper-binding protein CopC [Cellulomonas sp. PhB143]